MLFLGRIRIFHFAEHLAGQLAAPAAVAEILLVYRTIIKRTNLAGHLLCPKGGAFYIYTSRTGLVKKFTLIAD